MARPTLLSWSSGKDSAWTLHRLKTNPDYEVRGLVTTVNKAFDRVAMHGVRHELLAEQAEAAGLPLHVIDLPWPCPNEVYERKMAAFVEQVRLDGIEAMAFGDLFLEDIRAYRENKLEGTGLAPVFPLWEEPTPALAREMIAGGLAAHIACLDPKKLDKSFAGRAFDAALLDDLPNGVDPCGEHGEFHTIVTAGPMFKHPVQVVPGEVVMRDGFVFADFLPQHEVQN
jgi:uncharacterized protein (TIGR00290 family)